MKPKVCPRCQYACRNEDEWRKHMKEERLPV